MTADREIQANVFAALEAESSIDVARIGVAVHDGIVTLYGVVPTGLEHLRAGRIARGLPSVRAVANDLLVAIDPVARQRRGSGPAADHSTTHGVQ